MMNHRALSLPYLTAFAAALLFAAPAAAQTTECQPDDLFCAEVRIGPGAAGIRIGGGRQQPPPPLVVAPAPQPPVVVVQPMPPPPPVVYQPQPPPQVVVQQPYQPRQVVVQQYRPMVVAQQPRQDRFPYSTVGLHLHAGGLFGEDLAMVGAGGAFRIRPNPHLALDIGASVYGGNDYNGMDRVEVPVTVDALLFFNPQHRFQFYALVGVGASVGHADGVNFRLPSGARAMSQDYFHLGGEAGLGVEWRISRAFALNLDVRGFVRQQLADNGEPEFREINEDSGLEQSTNTSGGVTGRLGMTFYFGD